MQVIYKSRLPKFAFGELRQKPTIHLLFTFLLVVVAHACKEFAGDGISSLGQCSDQFITVDLKHAQTQHFTGVVADLIH